MKNKKFGVPTEIVSPLLVDTLRCSRIYGLRQLKFAPLARPSWASRTNPGSIAMGKPNFLKPFFRKSSKVNERRCSLSYSGESESAVRRCKKGF